MLSEDNFPLKYEQLSSSSSPNTVELTGTFLGFSKIKFVLGSLEDTGDDQLMERTQEVQVKVYVKPIRIIFFSIDY